MRAAIMLALVSAALAFNAAVPLFYELAVEASYPIGEGLVTMLVTVGMNVGVLIFLFLPNIPDIGTIWMNYAAAVSTSPQPLPPPLPTASIPTPTFPFPPPLATPVLRWPARSRSASFSRSRRSASASASTSTSRARRRKPE